MNPTVILSIDSILDLKPNGPYVSSYHDIMVQQRPLAVPFLINFINANCIKQVVEVGTGYGGLTSALLDYTASYIISVDIEEKTKGLEQYSNRLTRIIADCQTSEAVHRICSPLYNAEAGQTLFLIDGGYKMQEFNIYSNFLKEGDYIFVHDFAPSVSDFEYLKSNNIWQWHESNESQLNLEGLERLLYFDTYWKNYLWGTYQKIS